MNHLPFDVSRCSNSTCPLRHTCLRYTETSTNEPRPFNHFEPQPDGSCPHHIPHLRPDAHDNATRMED